MIATKERKQETVQTLAGRLQRSPTIYLTDFTGLDVARLTSLRRRLRAAGVEYGVVKNTLARRAFEAARATTVQLLEAMSEQELLVGLRGGIGRWRGGRRPAIGTRCPQARDSSARGAAASVDCGVPARSAPLRALAREG